MGANTFLPAKDSGFAPVRGSKPYSLIQGQTPNIQKLPKNIRILKF
jgi:hypothetical protein